MIQLPHLFVLRYLQHQMEYLRDHPDHITNLLCGFENTPLMAKVYGAKYIDQAIEWVQKHDFHYVLGYRLDKDKLPSICVTYEGGTETQQFIGDDGGIERISINPACYASFNAKDINADGDIVVSKYLKLENEIWRGLVVKNSKFSSSIKEFARTSDGDLILVLTKKTSLTEVTLENWKVVSSVSKKIRNIGSSMDTVKVKVYLTISGDPELCEMISCLIRYMMKQSRLFLMSNGLYETVFSHGPLSRSADFDESTVWAMDFTVTGKLTDQWIMSEFVPPDRWLLEINAKNEKPGTEEVKVWSNKPQP